MAQKELISNVFLDTQVFDGHQYDFNTPHFKALAELASAGIVQVFVTEVTKYEIEAHIREKASEVFQQLEKLRRFPIVRNLRQPPFRSLASGTTAEKIEKELLTHFRSFCDETRLQVLPVKDVSIEKIIQDYFEQKPPFGTGKKKTEFPDAIAANALQHWCRINNQRMYIVTGDSDWQEVCALSSTLIYKEKLAEVLAEFQDETIALAVTSGFEEQFEATQALIKQKFESLGFYTGDVDGEIEEVRVLSINLDNVYVIQAKDGHALLEVECEIVFEADLTYEDYSNSGYDREDDVYYGVETVHATVEDTVETVVNIELTYGESDPKELQIKRIKFEAPDIEVRCNELEDR